MRYSLRLLWERWSLRLPQNEQLAFRICHYESAEWIRMLTEPGSSCITRAKEKRWLEKSSQLWIPKYDTANIWYYVILVLCGTINAVARDALSMKQLGAETDLAKKRSKGMLKFCTFSIRKLPTAAYCHMIAGIFSGSNFFSPIDFFMKLFQ